MIFLTGGTGLVGSQILFDLASSGNKIRALRRKESKLNVFDRLFGGSKDNTLKTEMLKKELGEDQFKIYNEMLRVKQMTNSAQARLPFEFFIN